MCSTKIIIILFLLLLIYNIQQTEGFTSKKIKEKAHQIYNNKDLFKPGAPYTKIKQKLEIDPVTYDDIYKLSLRENLTISNLEKTLHNSIQ